jgi:hypothetical protein
VVVDKYLKMAIRNGVYRYYLMETWVAIFIEQKVAIDRFRQGFFQTFKITVSIFKQFNTRKGMNNVYKCYSTVPKSYKKS